MKTSSHESRFDFKSSSREVVRFLLRSRDAKTDKCRRLKRELDEIRGPMAQLQKKIQHYEQTHRELLWKVQRLEIEQQSQASAKIQLPKDPPINGHGYGTRMVSLAVNLAQIAGLRSTERVMKVFFDWLEVDQKIPDWTAIRLWVQRVGLANVQQPIEEADDWIWLADHSNQIGPEKVLVVQAVRASKLPPPGTALRYEDIQTLAVEPGTSWKRDDVSAVYDELAERFGSPRALVTDGAAELREGAKCLNTRRSDSIALGDFKHKAANCLKRLLGNDARFAEFNKQLGQTRSAIQQTELSHLAPPNSKQKARFMNLGTFLKWTTMAVWLLENPKAQTRRWMSPQRLEEKLGWLRKFADELARWNECQQVVSAGVKFMNTQGLFSGAAEKLRVVMTANLQYAASRQLADQLVAFVADAEAHLKKGERLLMSTEILESSFARFKQLERQHSKGGFTSLLASFAGLLKPATPKSIQQAFRKVSVKDLKQWVRSHLGETVTAKKLATYQEFKKSMKVPTNSLTTT